MKGNFDLFFKQVLRDEGTSYECVEGDAGGPTKCGLTINDIARWNHVKLTSANYAEMKQKVRDLDQATASVLYRAFYWNAVRADELPSGLDYAVVDYAVNSGVGRAIPTLGALVGVKGSTVTDEMLAAVNQYGNLKSLIEHFQDERKAFLEQISERPSQRKFRNGWLAREARVRETALQLASRSDPLPPIAIPKAVEPVDVAPPVPTKIQVARQSTSVWYGVLAIFAWISQTFKDAGAYLSNLIDVVFGVLPDAVGAGTTATSALSTLGGMIKHELTYAIGAIGIIATVRFMWRHVDFKHATLKKEGTTT